MQTQDTYSDCQVFTFCGHIADDDVLNLKSGYIIADTPQYAIESMRGFGFSITAISSLAEVRETIAILELIAERNPAVEPFEYLDLCPESLPKHPDDKVFTFVGKYTDDSPYMKMGFVISPSIEIVSEYLLSHKFTVHSCTSLADLREEEHQLRQIALGDPEVDDCSYLNLKLAS